MKRSILLLSFSIIYLGSNAQTWDEWFKQKKTQKKYLIQQIAAFKVYAGYLKQGLDITQKGLTTIENIKNGNFNLHRDFFSSLKNVNPAIAKSAKVVDIIAFQFYITRDMESTYRFCQASKQFTPEEIRYVARVLANMVILCDANISELLTLIRPDKSEMTDDERLRHIDTLYEDMCDKHTFAAAFASDARMLSRQRAKEDFEINQQKQYHGTL